MKKFEVTIPEVALVALTGGIGLLAGCRYSPNALRSTDGISSAG
jgi:hypothetical protein